KKHAEAGCSNPPAVSRLARSDDSDASRRPAALRSPCPPLRPVLAERSKLGAAEPRSRRTSDQSAVPARRLRRRGRQRRLPRGPEKSEEPVLHRRSAGSDADLRLGRRMDVGAEVNFSRANNLRLVVKGGGHSYQGTSSEPDSLLTWTRAMNNIVLHDAFVGQGCAGTA